MCGFIIMYMNSKICNHCQEDKSLDNFYFYKNRNTYNSICRPCAAQIAREKRQKSDVKKKMKESRQKYYERNKKRSSFNCWCGKIRC